MPAATSPERQSSQFSSQCFTRMTEVSIHPSKIPVQLHTVVPAQSLLTFLFTVHWVLTWDSSLGSHQADPPPVHHVPSTYSGPGSVMMTGNTKGSRVVPAPKELRKGRSPQGAEGNPFMMTRVVRVTPSLCHMLLGSQGRRADDRGSTTGASATGQRDHQSVTENSESAPQRQLGLSLFQHRVSVSFQVFRELVW